MSSIHATDHNIHGGMCRVEDIRVGLGADKSYYFKVGEGIDQS